MAYVIPQEPVESSNIAARGYDLERRVLAVTFKSGDIWHYASVPPAKAEEFFAAPSAGRFYKAEIQGKFPAEKMTGPCPKCGDKGRIGETCTDCGTAAYEPTPRPFVEDERGGRTPIGG